MLQYIDNKILYDYAACQQCGICEPVCHKGAISFKSLKDGTHEVVIDDNKCVRCKKCVKCCPANKIEDYKDYFRGFSDKNYFLGYNTDNHIRHDSSSGGVCKTIVIESLRQGLVDGVYTLKRTDTYPYAEGEFYTKKNIPDYNDIPNSVYHSVMACRNVNKISQCKRLIVVGTSCQLRAINELLKGKADDIIRVCIFCKQQKTLDSTRFLAKIMGTRIPENMKFFVTYRGHGWQGEVKINDKMLPWNRAASIPFGHRLWTVSGCNVCGDPFGINVQADISLMDPWKIRQPNELGETLICVNTIRGMEFLRNIKGLCLVPNLFEDVKPALDLPDVWRKQQLVSFFRGTKCNKRVRYAGVAEVIQRRVLRSLVDILPRMPLIFYLALSHFWPDMRNKILK